VIVGTSALIAILRQEPEALEFSRILAAAERPQVSVANFVEAGVVVDGARNPIVSRELDDFIRLAGIEILPVTVEQGRLAREAYRDFGRGSGHPAKLNFGDCFAYALAKESGEALLYQGNDFAETDVSSARGE
jgi:ribonuclease VapC